jgi:hypothetical protein
MTRSTVIFWVILLCLPGFVIGVVLGVEGGIVNTLIDFCNDSGSKRYIEHIETREKVC